MEKTQKLEEHISSFKDWAEEDTSKNTAENYATVVKGFYKHSNIGQIISLTEDDEYYEPISRDITQVVNSDSMAYGLKKYLEWRAQRSGSITAETRAQFLMNKLDRTNKDSDSQNIGSKVVSPNKVREIVDQAYGKDDELGLMLQMMYETAARFSGMNRLTWNDVWRDEFETDSLDETEIFISSDRSKGKQDGVVEITPRTLTQLSKMYEETQSDDDEVVFFPEMTRRSVYQKGWRVFRPYPKHINTHSFRHSRLTHLGLKMYEEDGLDYPVIKETLKEYARHAQAETTEIYIDIVKKKVREENYDISKYTDMEWS